MVAVVVLCGAKEAFLRNALCHCRCDRGRKSEERGASMVEVVVVVVAAIVEAVVVCRRELLNLWGSSLLTET